MNMRENILAPDSAAIRCHLDAWATPFVASEYDDGLCEIAYTAPGSAAPDRARLFALDELDTAATFAADHNARGANLYIGAALRLPDADRNKRASGLDFYAAAFACCEADDDATGVADRIEAIGTKGAIRIRTGQTPEKRVHHWLRLRELCDDPEAYTEALRALVAHVGADAKVRDSARILRLGGSVNWITDPAKKAKGYIDELTAVRVEDTPAADLDRLSRLDPMPGWTGPQGGNRGGNGGPGEILRNAEGRVTDGRETFWRQLVLAELADFQRRNGADPSADDLFDAAFPRFSQETEGDDRWTSDRGQAALRKRAQNTLKRLRNGHLAAHGLYSFETGEGRQEAEQVQAERDRRRAEKEARKATANAYSDPVDLWGTFPPPDLPQGLLPPIIEDFARANGAQMGADPSGLAVAALVCCAVAIRDEIKLKVKRHDDWHESARLWAALIGPPSTKKSPILSRATGPLCSLDAELMRDWLDSLRRFNALAPEEKKGKQPPPQTRLRIEDTTIEAAQEVLKGSPWGVLLLQDELSGFFGAMDKYNGGKGASADRAFWLRSFNGGQFAYNRIGRGAGVIDNLSISMLGGIQPEPLRKVSGDSMDDGLLQRLFPITLQRATMGRDDPMPPVNDAYRSLIVALRQLTAPGWMGQDVLQFDDGAQTIRRDLERRHLDLQSAEAINGKLASHLGKYDGLFARLCIVWHCVEHVERDALCDAPDFVSEGLPATVTEATAQRVASFLHEFLLKHAVAFYAGALGLSDDHDRLTAVAGYILARRLDVVTNRDVQRGDRTMRGLREHEIRPLLEQLAALGWLEQVPGPRPSLPPHWIVNPVVHERFADRAEAEHKRRADARAALSGLLGGDE